MHHVDICHVQSNLGGIWYISDCEDEGCPHYGVHVHIKSTPETVVPPPFVGFPKIPRWSREWIITEKIDGTNGQIWISEDRKQVLAGSKNRWLEPGSNKTDNFGFAAWAAENAEKLIATLGPGQHFGEWWGKGIGRNYGLDHRRFSLFNVNLWSWLHRANVELVSDAAAESIPWGLDVVPIIWGGLDIATGVELAMLRLRDCGFYAAPGWTKPEGIVIFSTAGGVLFKKTCENDEKPKGQE